MKVFQLNWPGITHDGISDPNEVRALLGALEPQLADAAVGLALFEDTMAKRAAMSAGSPVRQPHRAPGQMPTSYEHRLVFIYAHTVLYALDAIGKVLDKLAEDTTLPSGVAAARDQYRVALPDLVQVRDSAHHTEDRARSLDRKGKPLTLQPVNNGLINAPNGVLALSNLDRNKLGYTASDGHYREIEIGSASVAAAQTAIQQVLDAFSWRGPSRTIPL